MDGVLRSIVDGNRSLGVGDRWVEALAPRLVESGANVHRKPGRAYFWPPDSARGAPSEPRCDSIAGGIRPPYGVQLRLARGVDRVPAARTGATDRMSTSAQEPKQEPPLPGVVVLATGGTIAGAGRHGTAAHYSSAALGVEQLIGALPELHEFARVTGEQVAQIPSQEVDDALWLQLGRRVNARLADERIAGVVVTHGTDTIEETAYFLNLVSESDKPVVLTGAMRPATSLSADGPLNLYNSVAVAADPAAVGRGVLVVMNDEIHGARDVTKTHTTFVQTFDSPDRGPLGAIHYGRVRFFRRPTRERVEAGAFPLEAAKHLPRVDVVYAHASFRADLVEAALALGSQGIVVAGVGNGNISRAAIESLAHAARRGVVVVRSSRAGSGAVMRNVEIDDDAHGFVASDGLNPQKARILLQLALTRTRDVAEIQELFHSH